MGNIDFLLNATLNSKIRLYCYISKINPPTDIAEGFSSYLSE